MPFRHPSIVAFLALLAAGMAVSAQAQVQRSVGAGGRVTYSDRVTAAPESAPAAAPGAGAANLPYQLAQVAQRYPVVIYTSQDCAPCQSGRNLLVNRGVPFSEKTVESNDDIAALRRLAGTQDLPVLTIGAQRIQGYSDAEWSAYLDAAGYPKSSQLPASYRRPAATPLTPPRATAAAQAPDAPPAYRPAPTPEAPSIAPPRTPTNPAGIRF